MTGWLIAGAAVLGGGLLAGGLLLARASVSRLVDKRIAAYQNGLIEKHCQEVQSLYNEMRGWRHDYHNHIQTMKAYRALGQNRELDAYLSELDADLRQVDKVLKSGNVMVDAILNSKLSLARALDIQVNAKAMVPERLTVSDVDLCVVIGNLLDNAMEACSAVPAGAFLRVYIDSKGKQLYLSVTNTAAGRARKRSGRYVSSKEAGHGFGLLRVDRIVEKYGGFLSRADEEGAFTTEILLPL